MGRIGGFGHLVGAGQPDLCGWQRRLVVAFCGGLVVDTLVGSFAVVVEPEPVQQFLEVVEVPRWPLVGEPLFEGAVEAFQLPEGLGVIRRRVDQLDPQLVEALFEGDFGAVESAGEGEPVVREHLARKAVAGGGELEGVPRQLSGGCRAGEGGNQIAGVVV